MAPQLARRETGAGLWAVALARVRRSKGALRVSPSVQRFGTGAEGGRKSELLATETKTDGSLRTIDLPDSVDRALRAHRAR